MRNRHLCGSQSGRSTCLSRPLTQKSQASAPRDLCPGAEESGSWGCWQVLQRVLLQRVQRQCVVVAARRPREACGVRASGTADLGVPSTGAGEETLLDHDYQGLELSCDHLRLSLDRPILDPHLFLASHYVGPHLYLFLCLDLVLSSHCSEAFFPPLPVPKPGLYPSSCLPSLFLVPGPPPYVSLCLHLSLAPTSL